MLYLAGLGLCSSDIPSRTLEILRGKELYIESYTSFIPDETIALIKRTTGNDLIKLSRSDLEERVIELIKKARSKEIVLLVGGDPLIATTHKIILNEAKKQGVDIEVLHAPSILSAAIGESGLDFYRFGQIITIPRWSEHYKPISFYEIIEGNAKRGLHSLLLLDYDSDKRSSLQPAQAIDILMSAEMHYKSGIVNEGTNIIVLHNISLDDKLVKYVSLDEARSLSFDYGPTLVMLPGKLSEIELETLKNSVTE